jgi:hypothetical protein
MARKTKYITIEDDNRDNGKVFLLTEMPASQAERWATKALLALTNSGANLPNDVEKAGMSGLATMGLQALSTLKFADVEPLMDEMLDCVQACPDLSNRAVARPLVEEDIEEVSTRLKLRKEILGLHVDFFTDANLMGRSMTDPQANPAVSRITRTSRPQ